MKLVVFGLSLSSSWGNGHATTFRSLLGAFSRLGHQVTFYEWDAPWYSGANRDLPDPDFCRLVLYPDSSAPPAEALREAREADAVVVGSYVREGAALIDSLHDAGVSIHFYDIDTPVTIAALRREGRTDYLRIDQVPLFQRYLSFTGGPFLSEVVEEELGARSAAPLYCSVDPERYAPMGRDGRFIADLAYMGTYAPDRQPVIERFLLDVARRLPDRRFLVAGPQYPEQIRWPDNVRHVPHVPPALHPAFYSSAHWQLNATRADMIEAGWSPSVRLFEAAACGASMISDRWAGIESFFEPGSEIVLPSDTEEVVERVVGTSSEERRAIGRAMRERVLAEHTAEIRARELERYLETGAGVVQAGRPIAT